MNRRRPNAAAATQPDRRWFRPEQAFRGLWWRLPLLAFALFLFWLVIIAERVTSP